MRTFGWVGHALLFFPFKTMKYSLLLYEYLLLNMLPAVARFWIRDAILGT